MYSTKIMKFKILVYVRNVCYKIKISVGKSKALSSLNTGTVSLKEE